MQPDRTRQHLAPPPWDELREQRVLTRILEQRRATAMEPPPGRVRRLGYGLAAAALCAVVVLLLSRGRIFPSGTVASGTGPASSVTASTSSSASAADPTAGSTLALVDGSQVHLVREAGVTVEEEHPDQVRIAQNHGVVRYEVSHNPSREFSVHAANTTVRVRGTVFTVDVRATVVEVRVEHGRVEVDDGARKHELVDGEALEVPIGGVFAASSDAAASDALLLPASNAATPSIPAPATPSYPSSTSSAGSSGSAAASSATALQASADEARLSGRNAEAAATLEKLVRLYPSDARVPNVLFTLGRVERARGNHAASARAFDRCFKAAPAGPLAEDAFAETAVSWSSARRTAEAQAQARDYLTRWPAGPNAARMRDLLGP